MSKFSGKVGYLSQVETSPGVWTTKDNPRLMRGDLLRQSTDLQNGDKVNSNLTLNHRVSVIGDAYAFANYYDIKWVEVDGRKWEVNSVEVNRPRLILSLGGAWNGE